MLKQTPEIVRAFWSDSQNGFAKRIAKPNYVDDKDFGCNHTEPESHCQRSTSLMNPYEPPRQDPIAHWQPSDTSEPIVVRFPNNSDQMLRSLDRFRAVSSTGAGFMRYLLPIFRFAPASIVLLAIYVTLLVQQGAPVPARLRWPALLNPALAPVRLLLILILLLSMSGFFSRWRLRRALSRTHNFVGDVTFILSESGVQVTYPNSETKLTWNAFNQAATFDDGALLVQAPGFYWLPFEAIEGDYGQDRMIHLLRAKVPELIDRRKH